MTRQVCHPATGLTEHYGATPIGDLVLSVGGLTPGRRGYGMTRARIERDGETVWTSALLGVREALAAGRRHTAHLHGAGTLSLHRLQAAEPLTDEELAP